MHLASAGATAKVPSHFLPGLSPCCCPSSPDPPEECQGQAKTAPWPCSHMTRNQKLIQEVCSAESRAGALGAQAVSAGVRLLDDKAQACLCRSCLLPRAGLALGICFPILHMLLATQCWGVASRRPPSTARSCFLPAVCESSSSWEHDLMPSTKNDFHQGCGAGSASWAAGLSEGQEGGEEVWLQRQMESGPGRMSSAFFSMPFPF